MRGLLVLLLALPALAQVRDRDCRPTRFNRFQSCDVGPDFAFGVGMTGWPLVAGCTAATSIRGSRGDVLTLSRDNGQRLCPSNDGQSYTACSSGQVCITSGAIDSTELGILVEAERRRNQLLYPSDLTQADWVKSNVTCTKTVTGPLGTANSCSRCTATGANGTVKQTGIPGLSGTNLGSIIIRRATGTGAVSVTMDDFSVETAITSYLSSTRWRRVVPADTSGCAGGDCIVVPDMKKYTSPASYTLGIKLATSGDAVDICMVTVENLSGADVTASSATVGTPIDINDGARNFQEAETVYFTPARTFRPLSMSVETQFMGTSLSTPSVMEASSGSDFLRINVSGGASKNQRVVCTRTTGGVTAVGGGATPMPFSAHTFLPAECEFTNASTITAYHRSVVDVTTGTSAAVNATPTKIQLNSSAVTASLVLNSVIKRGCADSRQGFCNTFTGGSGGSPVAWVGDSITLGTVSSPTRPPNSLETLIAPGRTPRAVYNWGVGGYITTECLARWRAIRGKGFTTLVVLCGVNSAITLNPATAAAAWGEIQVILDEALADGLTVVPVNIMPLGNAVYWNPALQTYIDTVNSSMAAYCVSHSLTTCVDAYAGMGEPGTPEDLAAAYDSGDGLHPNAAGSDHLAALVYAKIP